jgi:AraC family transcriptional regulator
MLAAGGARRWCCASTRSVISRIVEEQTLSRAMRQEETMNAATPSSRGALPRRATAQWPGVMVAYAWEPPHEAIGTAQPNQVEVVFSAHSRAAFELGRRAHQIVIAPGAACVVGANTITWSQVDGWNEALSLYPDQALLQRLIQPTNTRRVELETVVNRADPVFLGIAHAFKRAVAAEQPLCALRASTLAHLLAGRLLTTYCGVTLLDAGVRGSTLSSGALKIVTEWIEAQLSTAITLDQLAALVHLSPFHFARCFKATTGLAPYQYVLARRMERAKQLLLTTTLPVAAIAWSLGYENLSHFRRLFAQHSGVTPGVLRQAVGTHTHV